MRIRIVTKCILIITATLNGVWKYVVDPYETGYYDYRRSVRDEQRNPSPAESLLGSANTPIPRSTKANSPRSETNVRLPDSNRT